MRNYREFQSYYFTILLLQCMIFFFLSDLLYGYDSLLIVLHYFINLIVDTYGRYSARMTAFEYQKMLNMTYCADGSLLNFRTRGQSVP